MTQFQRRDLLRGILGTPLAFLAAKLSLFAQTPVPGADVDFTRRYLAVRILRMINTAQHWHHQLTGAFASPEVLWSSEAFNNLKNSGVAERAGIGGSLIKELDFATDEIVPGWTGRTRVLDDGKKYFASLKDTLTNSGLAFSTDEHGIIYQGKALASGFDPSRGAAMALAAAAPLQTLNRAKRGGPLLMAAFLFDLRLADCIEYPCCSECQCGDGKVNLACVNCGCQTCVWCCCMYGVIQP